MKWLAPIHPFVASFDASDQSDYYALRRQAGGARFTRCDNLGSLPYAVLISAKGGRFFVFPTPLEQFPTSYLPCPAPMATLPLSFLPLTQFAFERTILFPFEISTAKISIYKVSVSCYHLL